MMHILRTMEPGLVAEGGHPAGPDGAGGEHG